VRTAMLMGACMLRSAAWIKGLMALSDMSRGSFQDCGKGNGWRLSVMQIGTLRQQSKMTYFFV
jgi:hypothetical protein